MNDKKIFIKITEMRKFATIILLALMAVPFLQSCTTESDQPDQVALVTVKKSLDAAGFYGMLDDGKKLYPSIMRVQYEPSNDIQRALVYFKELNETVPGFDYNADVYGITEVLTKKIQTVQTAGADTLKNGIEIINAYIGGGFINVEFKVNIDQYNSKQHLTVGLVDNRIDGEPQWDEYYPLELGFSCYPPLEDGAGYTITSMASFYIGEYAMDMLGCSGYELKFRGLDHNLGQEELKSYVVKPLK